MIDKITALSRLVPNANFEIIGDKIICHSGQEVPSEEAIQAKQAELQADYDAKSYARNRRSKFPNEHDLLIALWEKVIEGRSESADALEVKRQEVKTAHPKPE